MLNLFHKTDKLVAKADEFLDTVDEAILVFRRGIESFLSGDLEEFTRLLENIIELEQNADNLRREIRNDIYQYSLIPEFRADIINLLENLDDVVDTAKDNLAEIDIEKPAFPEELTDNILRLSKVSAKSAESLVLSTRAFFREVKLVHDRLHRVYYYEREADKIAEQTKRKVFQEMKDLDLSKKQQIRHFTNYIDNLANISEDAADLLTILAIKRMA